MPFKKGPEQSKQSREAQKASARVRRVTNKVKNPARQSESNEAARIMRRNQRDGTS